MRNAIFRLFEGLARQGPGSDAGTREALRRLGRAARGAARARPRLRQRARGAGAGATLRTTVIAVDSHPGRSSTLVRPPLPAPPEETRAWLGLEGGVCF